MGKESTQRGAGPSKEAVKLMAHKVIELLEERQNSGGGQRFPYESMRKLNTDQD